MLLVLDHEFGKVSVTMDLLPRLNRELPFGSWVTVVFYLIWTDPDRWAGINSVQDVCLLPLLKRRGLLGHARK